MYLRRPVVILLILVVTLGMNLSAEGHTAPPAFAAGVPNLTLPGGAHFMPRLTSGVRSQGAQPSYMSCFDGFRFACPPPDAQLNYKGGPVQHAPKVYLIFWLPAGDHFTDVRTSAGDSAYETTLATFFQNVGGSSLYNVVTQYGDTNGPMQNSVAFGGTWLDTAAYPESTLSDADIQHEVQNALATNAGWDQGGADDQYFVYTGLGIDECFSSGCLSTVYCGYHNTFTPSTPANASPIMYALIGQDNTDGCVDLPGAAPNGDAIIDEAVNVSFHESIETATDPELSAWIDPTNVNFEIGDECVLTYGPIAADGSNVNLNGHHFIVQEAFSNATHSCVQGFQRSTTFTVTSTGDSAACPSGSGQAGYTLRCALTAADADAGAHDQILFNLTGCSTASPCRIQPSTPLPPVTRSGLQILASSESGAYSDAEPIVDQTSGNPTYDGNDATPLIQLMPAGTSTAATGLTIAADGVTVSGFDIAGFSQDGILAGGANDDIFGNFIGTDATGKTAVGNGTGVELAGKNDTVGGEQYTDVNLIGGNTGTGITVDAGASGASMLNNEIGVSAGTSNLPNGTGIDDRGTGAQIGGSDYLDPANLVENSSANGIVLDASALTPGTLQAAVIVNAMVESNQGDGVLVENGSLGNALQNSIVDGNGKDGVHIADGSGAAGIAITNPLTVTFADPGPLPSGFYSNANGGIIDDAVKSDRCTLAVGLPCPVISSTGTEGATIKVVLPSGVSCVNCVLDLYEDDGESHPDGAYFLAEKSIGTFSSTSLFGVFSNLIAVATGDKLTATLTGQVGSNSADMRTSEFSGPIGVGCTIPAPSAPVDACGIAPKLGTQAAAEVDGTSSGTPQSISLAAAGLTTNGSAQVVKYGANPTNQAQSNLTGFFDAKLFNVTASATATIVDCAAGSSSALMWFNGTQWSAVSPAASTTANPGCLTFSAGSTSSPSASQLTGTPFAAARTTTRALLRRLTAVRRGSTVTLTWRVPDTHGLAGFSLTSGRARLNHKLIPVHAGPAYRATVWLANDGIITLRAVLTSGRTIVIGRIRA